MALIEEFQKTGNWLFKRRGYLPAVLVATGIVIMVFTDYSRHPAPAIWYKLCCLGISAFGLWIRIYTVGHTPKHTSGRNISRQKAQQLNTTGIYSLVRHPLYLGNFFIWLGIAMVIANAPFVIISLLVFWLYYERIMFAEEAFLREKFGDEFNSWAALTPSFIPRLNRYVSPRLPFSMKNVFKREYNGFGNIVATFTLIELLRSSLISGRIYLPAGWIIFFAAGVFIWFTIRTLEKNTGIFEVEGR